MRRASTGPEPAKEHPISGLTRRVFLIGSIALASGCGRVLSRRHPRLRELYGDAVRRDLPPLVVIPGAFGSRLMDERTGREVWPGRSAVHLLLSDYRNLEVGIDEETLEPVTTGIRPYAVFEDGIGRDFYGQALRTLESVGGYRRRHAADTVNPRWRGWCWRRAGGATLHGRRPTP